MSDQDTDRLIALQRRMEQRRTAQHEVDRRDGFIAAALTGLCATGVDPTDCTEMVDRAIRIADRLMERLETKHE